jgi:two-component sensor histidine kinase
LNPKAAEQIGLALHELGTNAVKHGALSVPTGVVTIRWDLETGHNPVLRFTWEEVGGPRVEQPQRQGFGDVVLTEIVPLSLRGNASLAFEPEGVKWVLLASSSSILA